MHMTKDYHTIDAFLILTVTLSVLTLFSRRMLCAAQPDDTIFMINDLTETTLQLIWDHNPESGVIQYILMLTNAVTGETQSVTVYAGTAAQTFLETFNSLNPATEYLLQIDVVTDNQATLEAFFGPDTVYTRPFPPEQALITQTADDAVRFEWLPPTTGDYNGYVLVLSEVNDPANVQTVYLDRETLFYDVSMLQADVDYSFGIYTFAGPEGDNAVLSDLAPTAFVPLAPIDGNVRIDSVTSSSLNVLWDAYDNAESYLVTLVDANNQVVDILVVDGQTTPLAFSGLDPSTFYEARVEVVTDGASTYAGDSSATTLPDGAPSGVVNVQSVTMDTITINFTEISGATSYQIIYTDDKGVTRMLTSTGSPFTIPGLDSVTLYNIQVNSLVGGQAQLVGTTTGTTDFPTANINPVVTDVGTNTFTITWEDISDLGFTSYEITYTNEDGITMTVTVPAIPGIPPSQSGSSRVVSRAAA